MPKATEEAIINNENNKAKVIKSTTNTKKNSTVKNSSTKKKETKVATKSAVTKKSTSSTRKSSKQKKQTTTKNSTTTKNKATTSTTKRKSTTKSKKSNKNIVAEYYDLPYRYNETIVKILYQTPSILFVYWDISDYDRERFIKEYGENFFYNTKPILKIFNITKNYSFEIDINDFANSWYINVNDANCEYKVELARRTINFQENLNTDYIYISSSNDIEFPNDHILLEDLPNVIKFKNVKTNEISTKNISTFHLVGINKIYNVYDFYKNFYKDEILEEINSNIIINPSSSSWN